MKKLLLAAALGALVFQSCKKDDSSTNQLMGNWKMTMYAVDTNNDGVMQPDEHRVLDTANYGYLTVSDTKIVDSYKIDGLRIVSEYTYTRRNDTVYEKFLGESAAFGITKLDGTSLNIVVPGGTGFSQEWRNYSRQ